jgi:acetolactate synthase-1/2/3 large subunit
VEPGVQFTEPNEAPGAWQAADLIVGYLEQLGVRYVFGVPGGAIEPFLNAVARSSRVGGVTPVIARHESNAAFMAHGYYQASGKLAVCFATTGPGAANMVNGVASAHENDVPMLAITAQTALANFGRGALQDSSCTGIDTVGIYRYFTRYNSLVSHVSQLEHKLAAAIIAAYQPPFGPAHLSIPMDVLKTLIEQRSLAYNLEQYTVSPSLVDKHAADAFCRMLSAARKPVFVMGGGCGSVAGTILELALLLDAAVVTTPHGKGFVSPYHPQYRGVIGFAGHTTANDTVIDKSVDLVVALGTNLSEWSTSGWDKNLLLNDRLVHVDNAVLHLERSPMSRLHVQGELSAVFEHVRRYLNDTALPFGRGRCGQSHTVVRLDKPVRHFRLAEEDKCRSDSLPLKPQRLMSELTRIFPPETRYYVDAGNSLAWAIHYLHPLDRRVAGSRERTVPFFNATAEWASMGWAINACIGAARAEPDIPVVCITGDGAMLMSGQEVNVAVQEQLPVVFIVLNDAALGMVKHGQRLTGGERVGFEIPTVDFSQIGHSLGAESMVIRDLKDLQSVDVDAVMRNRRPLLLDVHVDGEEVPPISSRVRLLGGSGSCRQ